MIFKSPSNPNHSMIRQSSLHSCMTQATDEDSYASDLNIACDNASRFKILCQKVTGEARKLSDMLIRQKNLPSPYQELLSKAENSSRASSQGCGRTTGDTTARRRPPALKAVSLQHLAMAEQLTHPKSTSSFLHLWSTPLTG